MLELKNNYYYTFGTDPEAFFEKDGKILGSERFIPEAGLSVQGAYYNMLTRDGVQFEFHPGASGYSNPERLISNVGMLFSLLQTKVLKDGLKINFNGLVEVDRSELDALSEKSRVLGCMPSNNFYGIKPIDVDVNTYRKRSSGGHIHIGIPQGYALYTERDRMVPLFDIFVGIPSVLLDRDPGAAERRQNYGRAGEYRLPGHGLEYRTISNYWLRDPQLMQFVFKLARIPLVVMESSLNRIKAANDMTLEQELAATVDIDEVVDAINSNNFNVAMRIFKTLIPFINQNFLDNTFGLNAKNVQEFVNTALAIHKHGIAHFFPEDQIIYNWTHFNQYAARNDGLFQTVLRYGN